MTEIKINLNELSIKAIQFFKMNKLNPEKVIDDLIEEHLRNMIIEVKMQEHSTNILDLDFIENLKNGYSVISFTGNNSLRSEPRKPLIIK